MVQVEHVSGWHLHVPPKVHHAVGGTVRYTSYGVVHWYPNKGDYLYEIARRTHANKTDIWYYVRRANGGEAFLRLRSQYLVKDRLAVVDRRRVPRAVLAIADRLTGGARATATAGL